jgi:hypothetical protein
VPAESLEDALEAVKTALDSDQLHPTDFQSVVRLDLTEWVPYDEHYPGRDDLEALERSGVGILYGPFNAYTSVHEH